MQSRSNTLQRRVSGEILSRLPLAIVLAGFVAIVALSQNGCITKRTVTRDGVVVEEKTIIKRPVKDFIENAEFE